EDALDELEVERVAVRHHEVGRAGGRLVHHPRRLLLDHHAHVLADRGGKNLGPRIDPGEAAGQALQDARHLLADVARAEEDDFQVALRFLHFLFLIENERHAAAAALAERVAEREAPLAARFAREQHLARDLERAVLEVAAAYRAARLVRRDPHPGAGLPWRRALRPSDEDFDHEAHGGPSGSSPESPGLPAELDPANRSSSRPRRRSRGTPRARA